jgi:adenine phosphoribosyltransferase
MKAEHSNLKKFIRDIPDWPKKGILFRDITPLLAQAEVLAEAVDLMAAPFSDMGVDYVASVEARGFIFGSAVAQKLKAGFVPIRKKNKLPYETESVTYDLEYGNDTLEVHRDAMEKDSNVLMLDDLLATGGTMAAACDLIKKISGKVIGITFLIELSDLCGRSKLQGYDVHSVITF